MTDQIRPPATRPQSRDAARDGTRAAQLRLHLAGELIRELDHLLAQLPDEEQKLVHPSEILVTAAINDTAATYQLRSLLRG